MNLVRRQWTLRRIMTLTALVAVVLTLSRFPVALGLAFSVTALGWFAVFCFRGRRYRTAAWFIALCPALFLVTLHLDWAVGRAKIVSQHAAGAFDGLLGGIELATYASVFLYLGSIVVLLKVVFQQVDAFVRRRNRTLTPFERAAVIVAAVTPFAWVAIAGLAFLDPFGVLSDMFD